MAHEEQADSKIYSAGISTRCTISLRSGEYGMERARPRRREYRMQTTFLVVLSIMTMFLQRDPPYMCLGELDRRSHGNKVPCSG